MLPVVLCLHGWGGSKESWTELREALRGEDVILLTPDLPGFGDEPEPNEPWDNDAYASWVERWVGQHNVLGPIIVVGHSHGGRIAIKLAAQGRLAIKHLILCAPAGIRRGQPIKRLVGLLLAKTGKLLLSLPLMTKYCQPAARALLYRLLRTHDYETASPAMRQTMVRVTAENLRPLLPSIHVPTDIFWGDDDRITPLADGLLLHAELAGSTLHRYPGVRHAVHRAAAKDIAEVIRKAL